MGWEKLRGKGLDFIVYNTTADDGGAFGADAGELTLLTRDGNSHTFEMQAKRDAAHALIRHLIPLCTTP
jgi:phosphopantothenoylcysteine synthetase/decarboxylase